MCGIAGFYVRGEGTQHNLTKLTDELMYGIDKRGGDACGYVAVRRDGSIQEQKAAGAYWKFMKEMRPIPVDTRMALIHTRLATQGLPEFADNNHPVRSGNTRVVHNGVIYNDNSLFTKLECERMGRVDSEVIPAVIEHYGWPQAVQALGELDGWYAIAAHSEDAPDELLLAKGPGSPLMYYITKDLVVWSSTKEGLKWGWSAGGIGTPPSASNIKEAKDGEFILIRDGEIEMGKFDYLDQWHYTTEYYQSQGGYKGGSRYGTLVDYDPATDDGDSSKYVYTLDPDTGELTWNGPPEWAPVDDRGYSILRTAGGNKVDNSRLPSVQGMDEPVQCQDCGEIADASEMIYLGNKTFMCEPCLDWAVQIGEDDDQYSAQAWGVEKQPGDMRCPSCMEWHHVSNLHPGVHGMPNDLYCEPCIEDWKSITSSGPIALLPERV